MIMKKWFDYFGEIPVSEVNGYTYINLLGKHLVCEDLFFPSDENHVAYVAPNTNVAFIRKSDGLGFYFPPQKDNVLYIVTPDIKKICNRSDLVAPIIISMYSENTYEASHLI